MILIVKACSGFGQNLDVMAYESYNKQDYKTAISLWNKYLETGLGKSIGIIEKNQILFNIAQSYFNIDSNLKSIDYLNKILLTDSSFNNVYNYIARAYNKEKMYNEALAICDISLRKKMNEDIVLYRKMFSYFYISEFEKVIENAKLYEAKFGLSKHVLAISSRSQFKLSNYSKSYLDAIDAYSIDQTYSFNLVTLVMLYSNVQMKEDICVIYKTLKNKLKEHTMSDLELDEVFWTNYKKVELLCEK